jgi:hypothetical protein
MLKSALCRKEIPTVEKIAWAIREDKTLPNIQRSSLAKGGNAS